MLGVLSALMLASYLGLSSGFQCFPAHPQSQFCNSDYVLRVKVNSGIQFEPPPLPGNPNHGRGKGEKHRGKPPHKLGPDPLIVGSAPLIRGAPRFGLSEILTFQKVTIKRLLRGKDKVLKSKGVGKFIKDKYIRYNATVYMAPGVKLLPNKAYLIAGKIIDNKLWLSGCSLHTEWEKLSREQLGGVKKYYTQGCMKKCSVQVCFGNFHCKAISSNPNTCVWRFDGRPGENCYVRRSACKRKGNRCVWKATPNLVKCKKDKQKKNKNKNKLPLP